MVRCVGGENQTVTEPCSVQLGPPEPLLRSLAAQISQLRAMVVVILVVVVVIVLLVVVVEVCAAPAAS